MRVIVSGLTERAVRRTYSTMGRPAIGCRTLGRRDFIRVPWPAARITTCVSDMNAWCGPPARRASPATLPLISQQGPSAGYQYLLERSARPSPLCGSCVRVAFTASDAYEAPVAHRAAGRPQTRSPRERSRLAGAAPGRRPAELAPGCRGSSLWRAADTITRPRYRFAGHAPPRACRELRRGRGLRPQPAPDVQARCLPVPH